MNFKESSLIRACKTCDFKAVQELLAADVAPDEATPEGGGDDDEDRRRSSSKKNKKARKSGAGHHHHRKLSSIDVDCREPKFRMTPLMMATLKGSRDIVVSLVKHGAGVRLKDAKGNTALHLACMKQRFHVIDALLQHGASPNELNEAGWNCLTTAVNYFHEDNASMLLLLLQTGAKTDIKDPSGLISIDYAVKLRKINVIRVLLNYDTNLAALSTRALVNAAIKGYLDIVLLLLNFGVSPNKIDPVTGTGPLHEAVRYTETKTDAARQDRLKIVHLLVLYGASPELMNTNRETPMKLATQKGDPLADAFVQAMKTAAAGPLRKPKFVNPGAVSPKDVTRPVAYSALKPSANWTRNETRYCSSYEPVPGHARDLVTNLLDGDASSMWTVAGAKLNWVIFDLKAAHVLTKIRIYCWKSKEMPHDCFLQVSNSLEGPWSCVQSFRCEMVGSSTRGQPGVPVDFDGFHAVSRFWRLVLANNHGASVTSLHGVELFGYDQRISKLLEPLKLSEYEDALYENGLNQIQSLSACSQERLRRLVPAAEDRERLAKMVAELRKSAAPLAKLEWFNEPVGVCVVGHSLPSFSVTSGAPFHADTLQLVGHGGALLRGETSVDLEPGEELGGSMAIFKNISFASAGLFSLEIFAKANPKVRVRSQPIRVTDASTVESDESSTYPSEVKDVNNNINTTKVRSGLTYQLGSNEDEDEDAEAAAGFVYNLADFSRDHSKMKINKWLLKSIEHIDRDDDSEHNENVYYAADARPIYEEIYSMAPPPAKPPRSLQPAQATVRKDYEVQSFSLEFNDEASSLASTTISTHLGRELAKKQARASYHQASERPRTEARVFVGAESRLFQRPSVVASAVSSPPPAAAVETTMASSTTAPVRTFYFGEQEPLGNREDTLHSLSNEITEVSSTLPGEAASTAESLCGRESSSLSSSLPPPAPPLPASFATAAASGTRRSFSTTNKQAPPPPPLSLVHKHLPGREPPPVAAAARLTSEHVSQFRSRASPRSAPADRRSLMESLHQELELKLLRRRQSMSLDDEPAVAASSTTTPAPAAKVDLTASMPSPSAIDMIVEEAFECLNSFAAEPSPSLKSLRRPFPPGRQPPASTTPASAAVVVLAGQQLKPVLSESEMSGQSSGGDSDSDATRTLLLLSSETFTSKARRALEAYKLSKSSTSSSKRSICSNSDSCSSGSDGCSVNSKHRPPSESIQFID